ncbi:MAG: YihY/virulence factor BrkB family protein [Bacteroidetes bacterium]|nr:YihY/virulence factor BrkB family protein [Bacteroidota bacterium]
MKMPDLQKIKAKFWALPGIVNLVAWSKKSSLPGFFSVPIFDVLVFIRNEIRRFALVTRANSMAFSFFLSLFPALIVLLTLLPYISDYILVFIPEAENLMIYMEQQIKMVMPGNAGDMLFATIKDLTTRPRNGLLSFGFLLAVFFASNGMMSMMLSFEKAHVQTFKNRTALRKRMISIALTGLLGILLIASAVFLILGNFLIAWLSDFIRLDWFGSVSVSILRYLIILLLFYSIIAMIYRYAVPYQRRFSFLTPGATLSTFLSILSSMAFSFYVENFNTYNKLYGSIGTIIVIMLWIQINCFVLLVGFELNASIAVNRDLKKERPEEIN